MSAPHIPPRPVRSQHPMPATALDKPLEAPYVPPRPLGRRHDRSVSPGRDAFAPSPLNDPPFLPKNGTPYNYNNTSSSSLDLPARPPSVTLPSIGQEGNEYANIDEIEQEQPLSRTVSGTHTSHVGSDLPLHAPKPSLSQSDARARVQVVTRTDSDKAAAAGVGVSRRLSLQTDDKDPQIRGLKSSSSLSFRTGSAASTERPASAAQGEEQGIPEIGIQVPMYPNAGDVQAPSPALHNQPHATSGGFHPDKPRHHGRTRSGREVFHGPPGSYGLHGHGYQSTDKFEKAWYEKHPEAIAMEGLYSPALNNVRGEYVLSSEDLNKLVHDTSKGSGFGTAPDVVGLPDEQIGYMASEEYASRMASRPTSSYSAKAHGNNSQTHLVSPLRKASFPVDLSGKPRADDPKDLPELSQAMTEIETEDDVIHIDAPEHKFNKVTGGDGPSSPVVDLGPQGGNTDDHGGFIDEKGYGVPILASDEIRPDSAWQRPAVSPIPDERRASAHDIVVRFGSRPGSTSNSRPSSRPGSMHGVPAGLVRFTSHDEYEIHTPLEDVEEYEPLFKDDEKVSQKPETQADRLKHRPDIKRRFPSQDIWEDTPNSLQLQAHVETPEPTESDAAPPPEKTSKTFESPETEAARKGEITEQDKANLIPAEERLEKSNFKPHIRQDMTRPGLAQRFPSRDIWEDSPDSARLETTVEDSQNEEGAGLIAGAVVTTAAVQSRNGATVGAPAVPNIPPRPTKSKHHDEGQSQIPVRPLRHKSSVPQEHSRLSEVYTASAEEALEVSQAEPRLSPVEGRKAPSIPDRPKPHVSARPAKADSISSDDAAPVPKVKPQVPARPVGGKIAALQAGFMSDLNNRLKLGPQAHAKLAEAEKAEVEPEEKAPLADARKGRAKGPARRKPAASPSAPVAEKKSTTATLSIAKPFTLWEVSSSGKFSTSHASAFQERSVSKPMVEQPQVNIGTNTAGEALNPIEGAPKPDIKPLSIETSSEPPPPAATLSNAALDSASADITSTPLPKADIPADPKLEDTSVSPTSSPAVQTGETKVTVSPGSPQEQKLTVIQGGNALTGEDVVVSHDAAAEE